MMVSLTHVNEQGEATMVDVSEKQISTRIAQAHASISMNPHTFNLLIENQNKKGDVLQVARIAGIQAAKRCADLIPLCHPLLLSKVQVNFRCDPQNNRVHISSLVKISGQTGVVSVAALTVFDMCKATDPEMIISNTYVEYKTGGKSGEFKHKLTASEVAL
jgi:cyclic pyranopterin phosphate synthase